MFVLKYDFGCVQVFDVSYVYVYGIIINFYEEIDMMWELYGVKKNKFFFIWVDWIWIE